MSCLKIVLTSARCLTWLKLTVENELDFARSEYFRAGQLQKSYTHVFEQLLTRMSASFLNPITIELD